MRILFYNPEIKSYVRSATVPMGLLSIASFLQSHGHVVKIVDRTLQTNNIDAELADFSPDIVGVSVMSNKSVTDAVKISKRAKAHGKTVVWGSTLPSEVPELVVDNYFVDCVSVGEGEMTWLELLDVLERGKDIADVAGLVFQRDGKIITTAQRELMDLADLPPTDWTLIDVPRYFQPYYGCKKTLYLYSSKGCPGQCEFCFNPTFHRSSHRERPVSHVMREIEHLVTDYGMDGVYFSDELFAKDLRRMHEMCDAFRASGLKFHWGCQSRIGIYNALDYKYMYDSGCRWIFFGVESGCPKMLKEIKKGIDTEQTRQSIKDCTDSGIMSVAAFIIGLPGETVHQLCQTVRFALSLETTQWQFGFYMPIPDTGLYKRLVLEGKLRHPSSLYELADIKPAEELYANFSDESEKELLVVRSYFMWKCFAEKSLSEDDDAYAFAKKTIRDALSSLGGHGVRHFVSGVFLSAQQVSQAYYYSHFFPSILKKYGLK